MKKVLRLVSEFISLLAILALPATIAAATGTGVSAPSLMTPNGLSIAQIKMTGDEFVVLQNNTADPIADLSSYWLYAFNKTSPSISGASSSGQQLPLGQLDPGQTLLLSSKARATCGAEIAGNLSLSFGDGNGFLQIMKQSTVNGVLSQTPGDGVSWGTDTSTSPSTVGAIAKVPSNSTDPAGLYYRTAGTGTGWQQADLDPSNACQLNAVLQASGSGTTTASVSILPPAADQPPATIISVGSSVVSDNAITATIPADDVGLSAPQVNELLANPTGTDNDDTDEFIELYNPNATEFDLTGFILQTGLTTKHSYVFPSGTMLPAKAFVAFYSSDTGLSLSNSSGQAALLDPLGNPISQSGAYGTAKDGVAWALAKGTWYWTTQLTPNAANVIKGAITATKKSTSKTATKSSATTATKKTSGTTSGATTSGSSAADRTANVTPIHPWTLAVVAGLAILYGLYEYRLDLANRFYQFRKHRAARRTVRYAVPGR